ACGSAAAARRPRARAGPPRASPAAQEQEQPRARRRGGRPADRGRRGGRSAPALAELPRAAAPSPPRRAVRGLAPPADDRLRRAPEPLRPRRIVELSVGSLVAGTKYRGEFEQRLLDIAEEAARHPEIVLFLDEIHTLVGAGASSGESLDASNIFKPALARGEL